MFTRPGVSTPDQPPVGFTNNGDGTYSVTYDKTKFPGTYNFKVLATVPNAAVPDTPFTRESQQSFYVIPPSTPSTIAVLGTDSVGIGSYVTIASGDIIVNNKLSIPNPQLSIATGANIPSTSVVAANTISVAAGSIVAGKCTTARSPGL